MIVRLVCSVHFVKPVTFESLLENTTFHETVAEALTLNVLFVVVLVAGDAALVSVNDSAGINSLPEVAPQLLPE